MAVRMDKSWLPLSGKNVAKLAAHLGVYQLANDDGEILYIGMAGGRTLFGLKGELQKALDEPPQGVTQFRMKSTWPTAPAAWSCWRPMSATMAGCPSPTPISTKAALAAFNPAEPSLQWWRAPWLDEVGRSCTSVKQDYGRKWRWTSPSRKNSN